MASWGLNNNDYVEFFHCFYREAIEDDFSKAFLSSSAEESFIQKPCRNVKAMVKNVSQYELFSPALFYKHNSTRKENLRFITAFVLDYDFGKSGDQSWTLKRIDEHIQKTTGFQAHFIWPTKTPGDYQAAILIEPLTGHTKSIRLYEMLCRALAEDTVADLAAATANHFFRLPRGNMLKSDHCPYCIDQLKTWFYDTHREKEEDRLKQNVVPLRKYQIMEHPAIQCLIKVEFDGLRNNAAFTLALFYYALGYSREYTLSFLTGEWYKKVSKIRGANPFRKCEVEASVRSAFTGRYKGPSKVWIEGLTGIEFPYSVTTKHSTRTKYKNKNENRTAIIDYLLNNKGSLEITQKQFADEIKIPYRSLQRELTELRNEGVISYMTTRGRGAVTNYMLTPNVFLQESVEMINEIKIDCNISL